MKSTFWIHSRMSQKYYQRLSLFYYCIQFDDFFLISIHIGQFILIWSLIRFCEMKRSITADLNFTIFQISLSFPIPICFNFLKYLPYLPSCLMIISTIKRNNNKKKYNTKKSINPLTEVKTKMLRNICKWFSPNTSNMKL